MQIVVTLVIVSQVTALIGDLALAVLVDRNPALLIAMNPRNRNLLLATNQLDAVTYYLVGFFRLILSDPLYYLLGFWYGQRAIGWMERRSRTYGPVVRDAERYFKTAAYPLIFIAPNNIICASAAATGIPLLTFIVLNVSGTVVRLVLVRQVGEAFSSPITWLTDLISEHRLIIFGISAVLVAWTAWQEFGSRPSDLTDDDSSSDPLDTDPLDTDH